MRQRRSSLMLSGEESTGGGENCPSVGLDIGTESNANMSINSPPNSTSITTASPSDRSILHFYRRFYVMHTAIVLAVLLFGMIHDGGSRKYIPVKPKELFNLASSQPSTKMFGGYNDASGTSCLGAYINVHSPSIEADLAAICCFDSVYTGTLDSRELRYMSNLCHPQIVGIPAQQLPFARRLTRFFEAWVLPLLPVLIRLMYQIVAYIWSYVRPAQRKTNTSRYRKNQKKSNILLQREATSLSASKASSSSSSLASSISESLLDKKYSSDTITTQSQQQQQSHGSIRITLTRLVFYFILINFRGWGLYIGANAVEDYLVVPLLTGNTVVSPLRTNSMSDVEHDLHYSKSEPECWYKDVLKAHHISAMENAEHSDCYGRPFDFSDHVVLFLAHYLPVFVMEMLLYYAFPFWKSSATATATKENRSTRGAVWVLNAMLALLFVYLHLIVLHALYQTAVYFHTSAEILVGYLVSLIMQVPIVYLMCSEGSHSLRKYLGLPNYRETFSAEKGD